MSVPHVRMVCDLLKFPVEATSLEMERIDGVMGLIAEGLDLPYLGRDGPACTAIVPWTRQPPAPPPPPPRPSSHGGWIGATWGGVQEPLASQDEQAQQYQLQQWHGQASKEEPQQLQRQGGGSSQSGGSFFSAFENPFSMAVLKRAMAFKAEDVAGEQSDESEPVRSPARRQPPVQRRAPPTPPTPPNRGPRTPTRAAARAAVPTRAARPCPRPSRAPHVAPPGAHTKVEDMCTCVYSTT